MIPMIRPASDELRPLAERVSAALESVTVVGLRFFFVGRGSTRPVVGFCWRDHTRAPAWLKRDLRDLVHRVAPGVRVTHGTE